MGLGVRGKEQASFNDRQWLVAKAATARRAIVGGLRVWGEGFGLEFSGRGFEGLVSGVRRRVLGLRVGEMGVRD